MDERRWRQEEALMAEIGTRRKRTVQEPLREPSREPVREPAPKETPKRKEKVSA